MFDLTLSVADGGEGGLAGGIEYSTEVFDAATIGRMAGHLGVLLAAVAVDPGRPLSQLAVLTAAERDGLVRQGTGAVAAAAAGGVHELAAARAGVGPDVVAVTCGGVSLSYGGLEERANRLAHYLRGVGVGGESVVGLCLERGAGMVVAMLAVWKAGGAYLPLDPGYPAGRLAFMLADSHASVLVSQHPAGAGLAGQAGGAVVWLDDPATMTGIDRCPGYPPRVATPAAGLASVIYTSGTTGQPKGTLVTHGSLAVVFAGWARTYFGPDDAYRWLSLASASFDVFTGDLVRALCSGGTLVVGPVGLQLSVSQWAAVLAGERVNALECAPRYADQLAAHLEHTGTVLADLRLLVVTTDVWRATAVARARAVLGPAVRVMTAYGTTETTIDSASSSLAGLDADTGAAHLAGRAAPIGGPLPGTRLYVLDGCLNPVPAGVAGDLHIGGAGVARGYGHRPALTAERFAADPLAGDGSRLYRTGDRARWLAGGELEFLGRADDQVKIRGYRIEPGEVEAALTAHPGVRTAVVTADSHTSSGASGSSDGSTAAAATASGGGGGERLVAWLVPADQSAGIPPVSELRAHLGQRLPGFMIPAVFTELAALPLTANGKLDRAALPAPDAGRPELAGGYVAPATPAEELLAGIWAQVLGITQVGTTDSFFDLGGHSLLATQVISRIRVVFGAEIPLADLFDHPTVQALAARAGAAPGVAVPPVTPAGRGGRLPLSFAQQRLWFLDQLDPGSVEYSVPSPVRLGGELDVAALGAALGAVTTRHEVLRTRLVAGPDGVAYQVIGPPAPFPLPVVDVSGQPDPVAAARGLVAVDAAAPFDLAGGPLIRAVLVRLAAGDHVLALSVHHVVSDEWSAGILRREMSVLYEAFRRGEPDPLPPLAVQYADFAIWQRRWLAGDVLEGQLAYWRGRLAGAPVLELPADRPRPPVRSTAGAITQFSVAAETAAGLRAVARGGGATMFMTLLAAFSVLLGRYSGQDDVVVGTPVANRNRAETEDLIGFFVNTLVLRADLSGDPEFTGLLGRVRGMTLGAYAHQDLPFEQLVDALVTGRDRSRTPLFQCPFDLCRRGSCASDEQPAPASWGGAGGAVVDADAGMVLAGCARAVSASLICGDAGGGRWGRAGGWARVQHGVV